MPAVIRYLEGLIGDRLGRLLDYPALWVDPPARLRDECLDPVTGGGSTWRRQWRPIQSVRGLGSMWVAVVELVATDLAPEANGIAELRRDHSGLALSLMLEDLPPAREGAMFEAWLVAADRSRISVGVFVVRGATACVALWCGADTDGFDDRLEICHHELVGGVAGRGAVIFECDLQTSSARSVP